MLHKRKDSEVLFLVLFGGFSKKLNKKFRSGQESIFLFSFHPESLGSVRAGTSSKPLVIVRQPRHRTGYLQDSGAFLAVAVLQ